MVLHKSRICFQEKKQEVILSTESHIESSLCHKLEKGYAYSGQYHLQGKEELVSNKRLTVYPS